jgi:hypothetical protein
MTQTAQFTIGAEVSCTDGVCGHVSRVVIDPVAQTMTHLVVESRDRRVAGRLVPLDLLVPSSTDEIRLRCPITEFHTLDAAEETHFLPGGSGYPGYSHVQAMSWPYFSAGVGMGGMGIGGLGMGSLAMGGGGIAIHPAETVTNDTLPVGEVSIRRGERVHATDGEVGRVQGLVIAGPGRRVTHILLQEGHLWGRKEVAIPIGNLAGVTDGIHLDITKQQVEDLAAVDVEHPSR